jgi:hypothetical protein
MRLSIFVNKLNLAVMNKNSLNIGIYSGIAGIVLFLITAIIDGGAMFLFGIGVISIAVSILIPVIFIKREREERGGVISFKDAFVVGFLGLLLAGVISSAFTLIYTQLIDTEYAQRATYKSLEMSKGFMEGNMAQDDMEKALREMEEDGMERFTLMGIIKSLGWAAIFYAVIALIVGAVLKKNPETAP